MSRVCSFEPVSYAMSNAVWNTESTGRGPLRAHTSLLVTALRLVCDVPHVRHASGEGGVPSIWLRVPAGRRVNSWRALCHFTAPFHPSTVQSACLCSPRRRQQYTTVRTPTLPARSGHGRRPAAAPSTCYGETAPHTGQVTAHIFHGSPHLPGAAAPQLSPVRSARQLLTTYSSSMQQLNNEMLQS